jgi:hypothetical protein
VHLNRFNVRENKFFCQGKKNGKQILLGMNSVNIPAGLSSENNDRFQFLRSGTSERRDKTGGHDLAKGVLFRAFCISSYCCRSTGEADQYYAQAVFSDS